MKQFIIIVIVIVDIIIVVTVHIRATPTAKVLCVIPGHLLAAALEKFIHNSQEL